MAFFKRHTVCILVLLPSIFFSQSKTNLFLTRSDTLNLSRRNAVIISEASIATAALLGLNELWYADYQRSNFHTINDSREWLQLDKMGHAFTAYQIGKHGAQLLKWSGVSKKSQLIYGATLGFSFLTTVEVLDGYSKEWGFSWTDILANASGAGLYLGQELLWNEQRLALKFSFHQTKYANLNPDKLGQGFLEQVLKDYNGQTYWLSINLHSFFKDSKLPKWFNVAFGYGGDGMISALNNTNNEVFNSINQRRQFYLSFDLNLNSIKTNSKFLHLIFDLFNSLKIPFPTIEFSKQGVVFHPFYY